MATKWDEGEAAGRFLLTLSYKLPDWSKYFTYLRKVAGIPDKLSI